MKHIWRETKWRKFLDENWTIRKTGIYLRFDKSVDPDVKKCYMAFVKWLRKEFVFPLRLNVYVKDTYFIKARDGDMVVGTFWRPPIGDSYPYMRLAVGDYTELVSERGSENAMWALLECFAHEMTHYFQCINDLDLTLIGEERQAKRYSIMILEEYDQYLDSLGLSLMDQ